MIRRLTLSQRLTLVFTAILLFCAAAKIPCRERLAGIRR